MSNLILKRIAISDNYYILKVLELNRKELIYKTLNRNNNNFEKITEEEKFYDYDTGDSFENLSILKISENVIIPHKYIIHCFDSSESKLRKMNYSIYDKETNDLFAPCCGKNIYNDEIKQQWGRYKNDFNFLDFKLEGYIVNNKKNFDQFILKINNSILDIRFIGQHQILIKDFFDYLGIDGMIESLQKVNEKEYILKIKE